MAIASAAADLSQSNERERRSQKKHRDKSCCSSNYQIWDDSKFRRIIRVSLDKFEDILTYIFHDIQKQPPDLKLFSTTPECQLRMFTYYRLVFLVMKSSALIFLPDMSLIQRKTSSFDGSFKVTFSRLVAKEFYSSTKTRTNSWSSSEVQLLPLWFFAFAIFYVLYYFYLQKMYFDRWC